ncbi:hypothetical protein [Compostimonas suwonensis]|uniref:Uncharacterized protein n=1 Tax=Compostimonas suwonensis TaxID=1048394 RepID=A0A2M9BZK3_9MICO|nr:hypothetical protein [Compostimonas suwonensis]PJJ63515.1 hypothetical protein CLV54_1183 [Compostimonas suwonensis]
MQWWNDFVDWFLSSGARPVLFGSAVIFVSILVSGLLGGWIARGATRRVLAQRDAEHKSAAIAALVDAATEASVWNSLTPQEQVLADRAVGQADIHVRLLPIRGSAITADWAAHQLAVMKRNSATFGYQLEPAIAEFRDRLVDWQERPSRARKAFQADLTAWTYETSPVERTLLEQQDAWVAQQHHQQYTPPAASAPTRPAAAPDTATQQLINDVAAIENSAPVPAPVPAYPNAKPTGLEAPGQTRP